MKTIEKTMIILFLVLSALLGFGLYRGVKHYREEYLGEKKVRAQWTLPSGTKVLTTVKRKFCHHAFFVELSTSTAAASTGTVTVECLENYGNIEE